MTGKARSALVTGSKGFIGRHLCARLRADGWDVHELDGKLHAMHSLPSTQIPVDVVFHYAAVAGPERFDVDAANGFDVNVTGTLAVLNYCRRSGARCVFASSGAVYRASDDEKPIDEEWPVGPASAYGMSKWLSERMCERMWLDEGVRSTVLRVFNPYGIGQRGSFLVPYIIECLRKRRPVVLNAPDAVRDFVYVDDVVEAMVRAEKSSRQGFSLFNIGSGQGTSVRSLVSLAEEQFGASVAIETPVHAPARSIVVADISKAKVKLGWAPRYDLKSGLAAMKRMMDMSANKVSGF